MRTKKIQKNIIFDTSITHRDWSDVRILFVYIVAFVFGISGFLFFQIQKDDAFRSDALPLQSIPEIDKKALEQVLSVKTEKENRTQSIEERTTRLVDPSVSR